MLGWISEELRVCIRLATDARYLARRGSLDVMLHFCYVLQSTSCLIESLLAQYVIAVIK